MRIYIAGPITNNPNYKEDFKRAEDFIRSTGHEPWNPVKPEGSSYKFYIDRGLQELSRCDGIYMLKGFLSSNGAILEHYYARITGLKIFYENEKYLSDRLRAVTK